MELLENVVGKDDHLASLKALRDKLARAIDLCESARDIAALSNRLESVLAQINELVPASSGPAQKGTPLDELAKRRAGRGARTAN